jgi:hypothetical protein
MRRTTGTPTRPSGALCPQHWIANTAATGSCRCFDWHPREEPRAQGHEEPRRESAPPAGRESLLSLEKLSAYSGISVRSLRTFLKDPIDPMPHYRPGGGKIYVRLGEFNTWMERRRGAGKQDLDRLVAETVAGLRKTSA